MTSCHTHTCAESHCVDATLQVSHSENYNWENGASADQIMEIAEIFQVLSVPDSKSGAVLELER
jgi:hypothetical protein